MKTERTIALAGNPNVGKSTIFNNLTGMKQHTGNWPGKTVSVATGKVNTENFSYSITDVPGTYSLLSRSPEEEAARDFLCFSNPDAAVIVCDTTVLERNLNLVLQIREFMPRCVICLNLADEARKKKITADSEKLSKLIGAPVVMTAARSKEGLKELLNNIDGLWDRTSDCIKIKYDNKTEEFIDEVCKHLKLPDSCSLPSRWIAIKILQGEEGIISSINSFLKEDIINDEIKNIISAVDYNISEHISHTIVKEAEKIAKKVITENNDTQKQDRRLDKIFTGPYLGIPAMLILTALIFYITITGANYPSALLSDLFTYLEDKLQYLLTSARLPETLISMLVHGVYRILTWIISVMLPPMAIFFPLFTLLEDSGYLPRIAFNLDSPFKKCNACGKQALTMCMGFGCNACGVTGCRIIDSKRDRLLAILTNSLVPCNGRFPALISLITMFFIAGESLNSSFLPAVILTLFIVFSILITFLVTKILSKTFLKGEPSSFTLELPSYRKPQIGKVIVRSIFDRTITVLGRAVSVAAPAGLIIWLFANVSIGDNSLLNICAGFLDPLGKIMGLDGIILMAFILGFPANEIVLPLIIMGYMSSGNLEPLGTLAEIKNILVLNGWNFTTALCTITFTLFHWPCSTTLLTVKKETGSIKMTALSAIIPTVTGILICIFFNIVTKLLY